MNLQEDGQTEEKTAILIVDDNEINRMILSETFRDQDKILEAENGKEALDLIRREPGGISAILLDIVMPEMDGLELLEILYKDGLTESIPVFSDHGRQFRAEYTAGIPAWCHGYY